MDARDFEAVLPGIFDAAVGNIERPPPGDAENCRRVSRLARARSSAVPRVSIFSLRQVEDAGSLFVPPVSHLGKVEIVASCDPFGDVLSGPRSPNQALEQGSAGHAVGAVQSGAGDLADRTQAFHGCSAEIVGSNAATAIVRRGDTGMVRA